MPEKGRKKGYKYLKCNFCSKDIKGGMKRVKEHLACTDKDVKPCPKVPKEVKDEISQYLKDYENTKFISQRKFDEAVDCGSYFGDGPSGCGSGTPLEGVNSCPSDCVKDAQKLFELLDGVVEEIGEDIVIQVITDNASAYKVAGRLLMEKRKSLYWTSCAAHCIDLMLEKIGELPQHKNAFLKARRVSNFIHNHQWVLSLTRKFAKKDILQPAVTRFATAFLTLESMHQLKQPLQMMFVSKEWSSCAWAKKPEGKAMKKNHNE
ncbi:uncharacterized protein LOC133814403 [Humulus lupulus]|uniref:uncharacterized protein LOC133814403 n=1 Tax=Humulus lupulus TaxID=3486 RepID=UPI002B405A10|nr:uncharacterized protein LOC133814403 [Humulus lupulus]